MLQLIYRYCNVSDWTQFEETESTEEKRLNWFETQAKEKEKDGDHGDEMITWDTLSFITFDVLVLDLLIRYNFLQNQSIVSELVNINVCGRSCFLFEGRKIPQFQLVVHRKRINVLCVTRTLFSSSMTTAKSGTWKMLFALKG